MNHSKSKKSGIKRLGFRMPADVDFWYKQQYLYFVNLTQPQVSVALKELTPQCNALFGEFPLYNTSDSDPHAAQWSEVDRVAEACLFTDSDELNGAIKFLRTDQAGAVSCKNLTTFRTAFGKLVTRFYFRKRWLVLSAFRAIWDGTGELGIYFGVCDELSVSDINTLRLKMGLAEWREDEWMLIDSEPQIPHPKPFRFNENISLRESFDQYRKRAINAYSIDLDRHMNLVREWAEQDLKLSTLGPPNKFSRVESLVLRNIEGLSLTAICDRLSEDSHTDPDERSVSEDAIWKSFKVFKEYDLPLRYLRPRKKK